MARVPPSLESLPVEILDHVVSFLTTPETAQLASTTRSLRVKLEISLYRNITIGWPLYSAGRRPIDGDPLSPIKFLLQRLLEAPQLVEVVQSITVRTTDIYGGPEAKFLPQDIMRHLSHTQTKLTTLHKNAIRAAGLRDPFIWEVELESNNFDAYLALILSLCRNLQSIEIDMGLLWRNRLLPEMLESVVAMHAANGDEDYQLFPQLQFLDLGDPGRRTCWKEGRSYVYGIKAAPKVESYLPLLRAKRLVHMRLDLSWPSTKPSGPQIVENQQLVYIKSLCLVLDPFSSKNLKWLLARVPSLKKLECDQTILCDIRDFDYRYDTIQDDLLLVKDSLEHLRLMVGSWSPYPSVSFPLLSDNPPNFKPLCHLRTLHISLALLSGIVLPIVINDHLSERDSIFFNQRIEISTFWHCLPESLEHLVLLEKFWYQSLEEKHWSTGKALLTTLTTVILEQNWRAVTPHLQRIDVDIGANKNIFLLEEARDLVFVCEIQGLACDFIDASVQWDKL